MKNLTLNKQQRLAVCNVVNQQRGTPRDLRVWGRLIEKIDLPDAERREVEMRLRVSQSNDAFQKLAETEPVSVELEESEADKLRDLLNSWPQFGPGDLKWLTPVQDQLA